MGRREAERGGREEEAPPPSLTGVACFSPGGTAHPLASGSLDSREGSAWG